MSAFCCCLGLALVALPLTAHTIAKEHSVLSVVAGKTFGGSALGTVDWDLTFSADGTLLTVTAIWGSQPFVCSNLSVTALNTTAISVPELDSWNHLHSAGGLCIANGITTNSVAFRSIITVGSIVPKCGGDVLNTCTTIILDSNKGSQFLLHQSFPLFRMKRRIL